MLNLITVPSNWIKARCVMSPRTISKMNTSPITTPKFTKAQPACHNPQHRPNKALHPTAYSSVRFGRKLPSLTSLPAAGELVVLLLARGAKQCYTFEVRKDTIIEVVQALKECSDDAFFATICAAFAERRRNFLDERDAIDEAVENAGGERYTLELLFCVEFLRDKDTLEHWASPMGQVFLFDETTVAEAKQQAEREQIE
jgi:hypothetical protein